MKFITLASHGGDYMIAAHNVAWLRTAENGQTMVGMVGGTPILVAGTIQETVNAILAAVNEAA